MKSFFKKLAFVMALAMVVTLAAPAAKTAVAAEDKKPLAIAYQKGAAITALNLADVGDEEDLRFVYAPENWKDLDVEWTSTNPNVVSVDDNGVVKAEAAGHAVVTVQVGDEYASIDVYSVDMEIFEATIGTKEERKITEKTIEIGESFDFAFFGVKDYDMNRYNCQWLLVDPAGVAELDRATGEVTAKAAGTCVLTLVVINKVTLTEIKVADCVITIPAEEVEVVVQPAIEAVQKTEDDFEILFTDLNAASYTDADIEVVRKAPADKDIDGNGVIDQNDFLRDTYFIYPTSADKDNNKFVVAGYADFIDGATYEVRVGEYVDEFVASVGPVASMELKATEGVIASDGIAAVPAKLSVQLFDKNGIDVTTVVTEGIENYNRVVYGMEWSDIAYIVGNEITFTAEGAVTATAYYDCYNLTNTDLVEDKISVIGKKEVDYIAKVIAWKAIPQWTWFAWDDVVKNNEPLWVAAGDKDYYIVALLEDTRGNYFTTHAEGTWSTYNNKPVYSMDYIADTYGDDYVFAANGYTLEFDTLNPDNLLMYKDGKVVTYKETVSSIKLNLYNVYNSSIAEEIASVPLVVKPARYVKYLEAPSYISAVTDVTSPAFDFLTKTKATVKVYDQYNAPWLGNTNYELTLVDEAAYTQAERNNLKGYIATINANQLGWKSNTKKFDVTFDAATVRELLLDANAANYSNRNAVAFKLTETISKRFVTIKLNLLVPNYTDRDEKNGALIIDKYRTNNLTALDSITNKTTVDETAYHDSDGNFVTAERKANIILAETSKAYTVGYETDKLVVFNGSNKVADYTDAIVDGTLVLTVTHQTGKIVGETATSTAVGVRVVDKGAYVSYELIAATHSATNGALMSYLSNTIGAGQYTIQVRTAVVDEVKGTFALATYSDNSANNNVVTNVRTTVNVINSNDAISLVAQTSRDLRESADCIEEVVANAFTFNRGTKAWFTGDRLQNLIDYVDYEQGDGYVYIKSVWFKVPVNKKADNADFNAIADGYYLYKVNIGRSVKVSTDLFYFGK